jgi:hypothetical protein
MSERYWITGVQLGMLRVFMLKGDQAEIRKVLSVVEEDQFIGNITAGTEVVIEPIVKVIP